LAVNAVMLLLLELPLIGFFVAPEWTALTVERFKGWMTQNGAKALVTALRVVAVLFIARAILTVVP
jgi:hypothetical protein